MFNMNGWFYLFPKESLAYYDNGNYFQKDSSPCGSSSLLITAETIYFLFYKEKLRWQ